MSRRQRWVMLLGALLGLALTARLGLWQLDRAAQKIALQQAILAQGRLPPLEGMALAADASQLHRRVQLRGRWLAEHSVLLENRQMAGRFGFYALTPLQLEGRPEAVLVQRGWLPRAAGSAAMAPPLLRTPPGLVELSGRLVVAPSRAYQLGEVQPGQRIRQNLDPGAFARETGLALLPLTVLQLDAAVLPSAAAHDEAGLLRDWPVPDAGLQKHYGYAFQWFALAALILGLYVWFQILRPRRHRSAA